MTIRYLNYLLIILFFVSSIFILALKGYFEIRGFSIENRADIERYANSKLSSNSFFLVENDYLSKQIKLRFNDVEEVKIKKNINMTISILIVNRKAFGKINEETYLSENGKIFYSKLIQGADLPSIVVKDFSLNTEYLNNDQMNFIRKLKGFPDLSIYLLSPFGFTIISDSLLVEVPFVFDNTENMAKLVNMEIAKKEGSTSKLIVLKDKIVFKK